MEPLLSAGIDTFLSWLNAELGSAYALCDQEPVLAGWGERKLALTFAPLWEVDADPGWSRRCAAIATQLQQAGAAPLSLWAPPETDLPHGDRSDFVRRIAEAAAPLSAGERGQVEFTVTLSLKKLSDDASYVHVSGGLAPHWARLTGRAFGQYELDTKAIHRLPEPESRINELLDWVVLLGNGMRAGTISEMKAEDAWTIRRPEHGDWATVIGAPPGSDPSNGTRVRRLVRQALRRTSAEPLREGTAQALVLLGIYRSMDEENATIALRSADPALYTGLDAICLIADGRCKPLVRPRKERLTG